MSSIVQRLLAEASLKYRLGRGEVEKFEKPAEFRTNKRHTNLASFIQLRSGLLAVHGVLRYDTTIDNVGNPILAAMESIAGQGGTKNAVFVRKTNEGVM